jgi:hypothetical protein
MLHDAVRHGFPDGWKIHFELARLLKERAEGHPALYAAAYDAALRAAETAPGAEPHYLAGASGLLMSREGRRATEWRERAVRQFRAALEKDPGHAGAERLLEQAERLTGASRRGVRALCSAGTATVAVACAGGWSGHVGVALALGALGTALLLAAVILRDRGVPRGAEAVIGVDPVALSHGPTGDLVSGPARPDLTAGPIGQVPRHLTVR